MDGFQEKFLNVPQFVQPIQENADSTCFLFCYRYNIDKFIRQETAIEKYEYSVVMLIESQT